MTEEEKKELINEILKKIRFEIIILGVPALILFLLGVGSFVKGQKGDPGKDADPQEIASKLLKDPFFTKKLNKDGSVPEKMVAFFNVNTLEKKCPLGWREKESMRGRYVVGMYPESNPGHIVGEPLKEAENRPAGPHSHAYPDNSLGFKVAEKYDGITGEFRNESSISLYTKNGVTTSIIPGAPEGTNAPYIQLLACEKFNDNT